nr:transforming growth factor, beta receptor associated protein 1 [Polyrhizophydium stewartii]
MSLPEPFELPAEGPLARTLGSATALFGSFQSLGLLGQQHPAQPTATNGDAPASLTFGAAELCGTDLFVGTSDGSLVHYVIEPILESVNAQPVVRLKSRVQVSASKKPVHSILAIPTESKLAIHTGRHPPLQHHRDRNADSASDPARSADGILAFYRLESLTPVPQAQIQPIKGVTAFCADKTVQSPLLLAVAKRRSVCGYFLDSQLVLKKEVSVIDGALIVAQDGSVVCAADASSYKLVRLDSGECTPLFPYEKSQMSPLAVAIGGGEFLLVTASAQGVGLGVFISSLGEPIRGTLQWPSVPISMVFQFPYVVTLLRNNTLQIHNFKTQDLVQSITFPADSPARYVSLASYPLEIKITSGGDTLDTESNDGSTTASAAAARSLIPGGTVQVVISFGEEILGLRMIPWETQVDRLLESNRTQQAVTLCEQMLKKEEDGPAKRNKLVRVYIRAGLQFIQDAKFQQALNCFRRGRIDPRSLIFLFPDVRPRSCAMLPAGYSARWMADMQSVNEIKALQSLKTAMMVEAQDMLVAYLSDIRRSKLFRPEFREAIDSTLLKLYSESNVPAMYDLLSGENFCVIEDCEAFLASRHRYFAQSLLYKNNKMFKAVLDLWIQLASGELADPDFVGMPLIVDLLVEISDPDLIWRYAEWVLRRDPIRGVKIFTERTDALFEPSKVLDFLESFGTRALKAFIEHLVLRNGSKDPALHTRLAQLYIDAIVNLATDENVGMLERQFHERQSLSQTFVGFLRQQRDPLASARLAFVDYVRASAHEIDAPALLARLDEERPDMHIEHVALLTRMKRHDEALELLALRMGDYAAAEHFCLDVGSSPPLFGAPGASKAPPVWPPAVTPASVALLHQLVSLYIDASGKGSLQRRTSYPDQVLLLLSRYGQSLDALRILRELPDHWGITMLAPFIESVCASTLHSRRESQLVRALARGQHTQEHQRLGNAQQAHAPIVLSNEPFYLCAACGKPLRDPTLFVRRPNGTLVHFQCQSKPPGQ